MMKAKGLIPISGAQGPMAHAANKAGSIFDPIGIEKDRRRNLDGDWMNLSTYPHILTVTFFELRAGKTQARTQKRAQRRRDVVQQNG